LQQSDVLHAALASS